MTNFELNRAIANATGENVNLILSRGFSLVDETCAIDDSDFNDLIADWDRVESETSSFAHASVIRAPKFRKGKKSTRLARTSS